MRLYKGANGLSGALVVAMHALAIVAALNARPIATAIVAAVPFTVSIVPAPAQPAPAPRIALPAPRMSEPVRDTIALPVIAVAPSADAASTSIATQVAAAAPSAPSATSAPAATPVLAPVFDADYLLNPAPAYPSISRRLNEEGRVLLRVWVSADGKAERVELAHTSGFDRLDRSALEAVSRWRFVPARQGPRAVAASVLVPVAFVLRG